MNPTTETTLRFTGDYPALGICVLAVGLAAAMWFLYRRESRHLNGAARWLPATLRSAAVFILVLALSGPVLRKETTQRQLGRVILAVDTSASMKLEDEILSESAAGGPRVANSDSRLTRAEKMLLGGSTPLLKKLTETQDVELVLLRGQQTQRLWWNRQKGKDASGEMPTSFDVQADAPITNLDSSLRDALGTVTPGTALVVMTDGQHNGPGSPEEFATTMKQTGTPIFTVGFGSEVPPPDLSVLNVLTAESVFSEENLQGRVLISDSLPVGIPAQVRITSSGKVMWEQNFTGEGKGERRFDFSFPVKQLPEGAAQERDKTLRLLQVQVAVLGERSGLEKTRANNSREVALHLLTKKRKVLILDGRPRWETRYIHNHFDRDDRWEAKLVLDDYAEEPQNGALQKNFPKTLEELLRYDLVLLGDVSPARFNRMQTDWLMEFVEKRGGGLILIDGLRGNLKKWAEGNTAALMPVAWMPEANVSGAKITWALSTEGERESALRLSDSPSANSTLWPTLPEMRWASNVQAQPGATTLAYFQSGPNGAQGKPAAIFRPVGAGAVLYLGTDDLWRWRYQVGDLYHQRLWMQLAAWIAAPPFQAENKQISIGTDRMRYTPGEQSEIRVRIRNATGELVSQAEPRAFLLLDGKEVATLQLEPDPTHFGIYRALTPPLKAGAYEIAVAESPTAMQSDLRLSLRVADAGNPEWATLTMNRPLLEAMATTSGGRFLREEQAATELPNLLQTLDRKQTTVAETLLWSSWWWFGAVIVLLTAEWLLRKRMRLV
ncbi:von Willebrand factor type A domain-containing protein [Prosthecobacter fusiformis]|uniref:von Willebrand factor type A domain-containing protein n=1 Tax=Prosthecobacter fusiformis TaxID=48464 RepID=A0A4V3FF36_9BACT|nr:vWA domain-containing protein [Prosthecobacter fusiformis]TDU69393.1 von Willebrand factor type A domain-containing protein [Prosthecobacter fusiformis]